MDQAKISSEKILTVNDLSLSLNSKCLLKNINFSMRAGEIVTILGPNGAGKTTLLKAIAGDFPQVIDKVSTSLFLPSKNEQSFSHAKTSTSKKKFFACGLNNDKSRLLSDRAKRLAVLPQNSELQFPFSVEQVVMLGRIPHEIDESSNKKIAFEAMEAMGLSSLSNTPYTALSGGEKQRVQLARVFAQIWRNEKNEDNNISRLLLLDEPSAALDFKYQKKLINVLKLLSSDGVGILIVSHDINLSLKFSDRFVALLNGEILAEGAADTVLTSENMNNLFGVNMQIVRSQSGDQLITFI